MKTLLLSLIMLCPFILNAKTIGITAWNKDNPDNTFEIKVNDLNFVKCYCKPHTDKGRYKVENEECTLYYENDEKALNDAKKIMDAVEVDFFIERCRLVDNKVIIKSQVKIYN